MAFTINHSDITRLGKTLSRLPKKSFNPTARQEVLSAGANVIQRATQALVPESQRPARMTRDGKKKSGSLKRSVQVFRSRKDRGGFAVLVGNVLDKNAKISSVKGATRVSKAKNNRAYYSTIVLARKKGSFNPRGGRTSVTAFSYIERGFQAGRGRAEGQILQAGNKVIKQFKRKYSL